MDLSEDREDDGPSNDTNGVCDISVQEVIAKLDPDGNGRICISELERFLKDIVSRTATDISLNGVSPPTVGASKDVDEENTPTLNLNKAVVHNKRRVEHVPQRTADASANVSLQGGMKLETKQKSDEKSFRRLYNGSISIELSTRALDEFDQRMKSKMDRESVTSTTEGGVGNSGHTSHPKEWIGHRVSSISIEDLEEFDQVIQSKIQAATNGNDTIQSIKAESLLRNSTSDERRNKNRHTTTTAKNPYYEDNRAGTYLEERWRADDNKSKERPSNCRSKSLSYIDEFDQKIKSKIQSATGSTPRQSRQGSTVSNDNKLNESLCTDDAVQKTGRADASPSSPKGDSNEMSLVTLIKTDNVILKKHSALSDFTGSIMEMELFDQKVEQKIQSATAGNSPGNIPNQSLNGMDVSSSRGLESNTQHSLLLAGGGGGNLSLRVLENSIQTIQGTIDDDTPGNSHTQTMDSHDIQEHVRFAQLVQYHFEDIRSQSSVASSYNDNSNEASSDRMEDRDIESGEVYANEASMPTSVNNRNTARRNTIGALRMSQMASDNSISARLRHMISRRRMHVGDAEAGQITNESTQRAQRNVRGRMSALFAHAHWDIRPHEHADDYLVSATLVDENEGMLVVAERVNHSGSKWKAFVTLTCLLVVMFVAALSVVLRNLPSYDTKESDSLPADDAPLQPIPLPSFDPRPTVEIVQSRGRVRCGLRASVVESGEGFTLDLCRAVAAVILGNADSIDPVPVTAVTRFKQLHGRSIDVLLYGDTHTIEREVVEKTTLSGFTFSSPYYYDGMTYYGNKTFVRCAEDHKRYGECSTLKMCVKQGTSSYDYVQSYFPSGFYLVSSSSEESTERLLDGTCNVIASDRSKLANTALSLGDRSFILGDKLMTKEPLAAVTRNDDREFSDIVNWVIHALFFGEEQGLTKDLSLCQNYTTSFPQVSDLNFLNAVHCVGNYGEVMFGGEQSLRGMNQINNGTTGMLYAMPFGDIGGDNVKSFASVDIAGLDTLLSNVRHQGSLNCGIVVPSSYTGDVKNGDKLIGMSITYCRTLAAALFDGDHDAANIFTLSEDSGGSFFALDNKTVDVLAGARIETKYDFKSHSPGGIHFSTPYYYGNEATEDEVSFFTLATREEDVLFASFVNFIVSATIFAQEKGIMNKESATELQLISIFGSEFNLALRDAIAYSGSWDQIYTQNFGEGIEDDRGRNKLNNQGEPQINSFPGLGADTYSGHIGIF